MLVHGVQYLGIEEPRLQRFAKSVVSAGIVVLTPQVDELADYEVSARSIETVGAAIHALRARSGGAAKVGLMGTSFGGGVSLLTAADPRFADEVAFVVAIGAHDDLARVAGFFATDEIEEVSGAHDEAARARLRRDGARVHARRGLLPRGGRARRLAMRCARGCTRSATRRASAPRRSRRRRRRSWT